jgi:hypothetical protein
MLQLLRHYYCLRVNMNVLVKKLFAASCLPTNQPTRLKSTMDPDQALFIAQCVAPNLESNKTPCFRMLLCAQPRLSVMLLSNSLFAGGFLASATNLTLVYQPILCQFHKLSTLPHGSYTSVSPSPWPSVASEESN